jgi:hypothetical protein
MLLIPALISLASCATAPSSSPSACDLLPLKTYTPVQQAKVADEIDAAPADAEWPVMVADLGKTRAAIRACRSAE